jgi:hypothetical protein
MLVPNSDAGEFERLIPNSRKVVFDDTGHSAMMERPRPVNDLIIEFLAQVHEPPEREEEMGAAATRGAQAAG